MKKKYSILSKIGFFMFGLIVYSIGIITSFIISPVINIFGKKQ